MISQNKQLISLKTWIRRAANGNEGEQNQLRWSRIQLQVACLVVGVALSITMRVESGHLGANPLQQSALTLAGLVYGFVGTPYVLGFLSKGVIASKRSWVRLIFSILWIALLNGSTLAGFAWLALNLPPDAPWHLKVLLVVGGLALVVAGWRETIASARPSQDLG